MLEFPRVEKILAFGSTLRCLCEPHSLNARWKFAERGRKNLPPNFVLKLIETR
jgi:hypothetical protein